MTDDDATDLQQPFPPLVAIGARELAELVMPWAEQHHPEKAATVRAEADPIRRRRLLVRLVELRWEQDAAARATFPLLALHETALAVRMRHRGTGLVIEVKGKRAPRPWQWTFAELANFARCATPESDGGFALLVSAKHTLELEHVSE